MGLLNRLLERVGRARASGRAGSLEAQGRLDEAFQAYREAGQDDQAARVLLARAQAEPDPSRRLALVALAASCAPPGSAPQREALRRRALLTLDLLRQTPGSILPSELRDLAEQLESLTLLREAAEVRGILGDHDARARLLAACGEIDALESTLDAERQHRVERQQREQTWNRVRDLDALGRRLDAIRLCEQWCQDHPADEDLASFARATRERIARGPCVNAIVDGGPAAIALGDSVTLGRSDSTITLPSPVLSRSHLRIERGTQGPTVADQQTRNGTLVGGARIDGPIPVGGGLDLSLGGQLPCRIEPWGDGVQLSISGQRWILPLGPLEVGPFRMVQGIECAQLLAPERCAPLLGELAADSPLDLCVGDRIRAERGGSVLLEVRP